MTTLKAAHFAKNGIHVFPSWISNGHWAIRRATVANAATFTTRETIAAGFPKVSDSDIRVMDTDENMNRILASATKDARPWTATEWHYQNPADKTDLTVYLAQDKAAFVSRAYLAAFGTPATLYGPVNGPYLDSSQAITADLIVMPVQAGDDALQPLISLVHLMDAA